MRGWTSDITEVVESRRQIMESERRFQDFADSASDWLWEADQNLRYTYFSERAEEITGIPPQTYLGTRMGDRRGGEPTPAHEAHRQALQQRKPFKGEISELQRPNGEKLWISRSGKPIFSDDGEFLGYRGVCRDVTSEVSAQKEAELSRTRLEDSNLRLEKPVAERTAELTALSTLLGEVIESMADGIVVFNDEFIIEAVNSKAAALSGPAACA